jgi:hypothetical protein
VGRFEGLVHDTGQVVTDRIQLRGVFQPGRERRCRALASYQVNCGNPWVRSGLLRGVVVVHFSTAASVHS